MSESTIIPLGAVINDYQVISLIGAGGYAGIYKVKRLKSNQLYAMKTESIISEKKLLQAEIEIMKQLKDDFFPKLRDSGTNTKYNIDYLVMDIYGASIDTIQLYNRKHLDVNMIYNVCFQMLLIIQAFHSYGFVHRDIKPSNFLIQNKKNSPLVLIDFGISKKHIDPSTNKPYPFKKEKIFAGTTRYASITACQGYPYGRRDDLVSWFYSFLDLYCGFLPWDKAQDFADMIFMKNFLNISVLNRKLPKGMTTLHKYLKNLKYNKEPDYEYIKHIFLNCMEEEKVQKNQFDWGSFYSKHSNLEVFTRELSLRQLKINSQKSKIEVEESKQKPLKKAKSAPIKFQSSNSKLVKLSSHFRFFDLFKSKSDSKKKTIKSILRLDLGKKSSQNEIEKNGAKKNSHDAVSSKNHDSEKVKGKKYPPAIPSKKKKKI